MLNDKKPAVLPLAIAVAILAVSTSSIFIRFAQQEAPSLVIAAYRLVIASLVLAPVAFLKHRDELRSLTRRDFLWGLLSGVFLALHFATWISSLEFTTVASSVVLVSTSPLWVALLAPFVLKEPINRFIVLGLFFTVTGGALIGLSDVCAFAGGLVCPPFGEFIQGRAFWGNLLALAGAWTVTGYLLIGRNLRTRLSLGAYIFVVYGMAAVTLLVIVVFSGLPLWGFSPEIYLWLVLLALVPQLIGHSTYNWVLAYLPAALVAIVTLGEPIGSTILAYLLLSEIPTPLQLVGAVLILMGIFLSTKSKN